MIDNTLYFQPARMAIAAACCMGLAVHVADADSINLAQNHVAGFDIVVPDNTNENVPPASIKPLPIEFGNPRTSVWETAHLLADYLQASTGATFNVRKESDSPTQSGAIHVGRTQFAHTSLGADPRAAGLDPEGFIHNIADNQNIVIFGGSDLGTEFGVYDFLERHVGVRWLYPGEIGEHVPAHNTLGVNTGFLRDEPKFKSRLIRPSQVDGGVEWAKRQRTSLRVEFHHNIPKLFPANYTSKYPELYPIINGERYLPPTVNMDTWHLSYDAEGAVEVTVDLINQLFANYPIYNSVSLGISDAGEDRNNEVGASRPRPVNSLGYEDWSDPYYNWANQVIEQVRQTYPDKYFGGLAYRGVADPPQDLVMDDHFVPFLTFDRMLWADPVRAAQDQQWTEAWAQSATELGWYDYLYGEAYIVPRISSATLQQALQFAYENNVRHYYAETYPSDDWHEGPKLYIAMKLLWDPEADVDEILLDWCEAAVGEDAAPYLSNYFGFWEEFWTERAPETEWFSERSKIYLIFNTRGYLEALTMYDLDRCSQWLEDVVNNAPDGVQRLRAEQFRDGFELRRAMELDASVVPEPGSLVMILATSFLLMTRPGTGRSRSMTASAGHHTSVRDNTHPTVTMEPS